jgi:hypothetical protein
VRAYYLDYYSRNQKKCIARAAQWAGRSPYPAIVKGACLRAKRKGLLYDRKFLLTLQCPEVCPVLGTPISFALQQGQRPLENTASLDQIVPGRGYIPGNVQILSKLANQMKSNATPEQLRTFAKWVLQTP